MREGTEPSRFAFHNKKTAVHVSVIISASEITDNKNIVCPKEGCYMKLAICDDDKKIRELIEESVREVSGDMEIEVFADARGILAPGFDADILFLDIQMPGIDGMNAARKTGSSYEENPLPGFGMALAGNMGYGMKASLVSTGSTDDVIVRVKLATGGGNYESVDVNLSEFNPRNATAVEMFAYCQYKDAMGEGSGHTWGSWSAIKKVISPGDGMNFGSLENIMNEKRNWTGALAESKTYMENPKSGETLSAADLLKMFEEQNKLTAEELKEGDDWRNMSDDDWDKLLSGVDNYIDAYKEEIREKVKKQMEAARKAAMEADPGIDHEKNWTKKLMTDDQTVLRTAKAAQAMESMALNRMEEMAWGVRSDISQR